MWIFFLAKTHIYISINWFIHLPQMANDGRIGPGVLCIQSHSAALEHNQIERLIKPPGDKIK